MRISGRGGVEGWPLGRLEATPKEALRDPTELGNATAPEAPRPARAPEAPRSRLEQASRRFARFVAVDVGELRPTRALSTLGPAAQGEATAAFVEASGVADLARIFARRAEEAARGAVLARSPAAKKALEEEALGSWLIAARGMAPHVIVREAPEAPEVHPEPGARQALERLKTFASTPAERGLFEALGAFFDGDLETGRAHLTRAARDAAPGEAPRLARLDAAARDAQGVAKSAELLERLASPGAGDEARVELEHIRRAAEALAEELPAHALDLVSLKLQATRPAAALDTQRVHIEEAHARAAGSGERDPAALLGQARLLELSWAARSEPARARRLADQLAVEPRVHDEHRALATLAGAVLAAQAGDLDVALERMRSSGARPTSPERAALAALLTATLLGGRGEARAFAEAERILSAARGALLASAGAQGGARGELGARLFDGARLDPGCARAPSADAQRLAEELSRAQLRLREAAAAAGRDGGRPRGLDDEALAAVSRHARLYALLPLARSADVPLSLFLDRPHLLERADGPVPLDPVAARLALARAALVRQPRRPESLLSAVHRPAAGPLAAAVMGVVAARRGGSVFTEDDRAEHQALLRRALGRELLVEHLATGPGAAASVALSRQEAARVEHRAETTQQLLGAARIAARGLARPRALRDLQALRELFGATTDREALVRPGARDLLLAATDLATAARLLERADGGAPSADWTALAAALHRREGPRSLPSLRAELEGLGFTRGADDVYVKGATRVKLEPRKVGSMDAVVVAHERGDPRAPVYDPAERVVCVGPLTFGGEPWSLFEHGRERELARYRRARRTHPSPERLGRIIDLDALRAFVSARGRAPDRIAARRAELLEQGQLKARAVELLESLREKGKLPRGFYLMADGIDAASKTSNGRELAALLERVGYASSERSFKAPTAEERQRPYLERFDAWRPAGGEVFLADRSPLGDFAYAPGLGPERRQEMAQQFRTWERSMRAEGLEVLKLLFYPGEETDEETQESAELPELWRPMFTFGKRQARAEIARDLLEERRAAGVAEHELPPGLVEAAALGPGANDLAAFLDGVEVHRRFEEAAELSAGGTESPWIRVGTSDRRAGRRAVLEAFVARLEALDRAP